MKTEGAIVIVKLFKNNNGSKSNTLITRTLGKMGVIDSRWKSEEFEAPKAGEFWKMKIIKEVSPNTNTGCFVLEPICPVKNTEIDKLLPGFFKEETENGLIYIRPNKVGNWIMPLEYKKGKTYHALIVDLQS